MIKLTRPLFAFGLLGLSLMPGCFVVGEESDDDDGGSSLGDVGDDCDDSDDCESGLVCDAATGMCARPDSPGDVGDDCDTSGDCRSGLTCNAGTCAEPDSPGDIGDDCDTSGDCRSGLICSAATGTCTPGGTTDVGEPCTEEEECVPGSVCFNEYCVGEGTMRVSLAFTADSDFDLHVLTPSNEEIYFGNPLAGGGELDVDQCVGTCGAGAHVENIVFSTAATGTYEVWVVNYDGRSAGTFDIEVAGVVNQSFSGSLTATADEESEHFTFTR
jgi:hypothetical protein